MFAIPFLGPILLKLGMWWLGRSGLVKYLIIGGVAAVLAAGAGLTIYILSKNVQVAELQRDSALKDNQRLIEVNHGNEQVMKAIAALSAKVDKIAVEREKREAAVKESADKVKKELSNVAPENDGPITPALERALDWLPGQPGPDGR